MKALRETLILAAVLSAAVPTALQAVAVALETTPPANGRELLYGVIFLIFAAGVAVGAWMQKKSK